MTPRPDPRDTYSEGEDGEQLDLLTASPREFYLGWGLFIALLLAAHGAVSYVRNHRENR